MKPTWQKARVLRENNRHVNGRELWVRVGAPVYRSAPNVDLQGYAFGGPRTVLSYETNIVLADGNIGVADALHVELLARSPDDFADHVEMVQFTSWLRSPMVEWQTQQAENLCGKPCESSSLSWAT
jgi:hypothetical protein